MKIHHTTTKLNPKQRKVVAVDNYFAILVVHQYGATNREVVLNESTCNKNPYNITVTQQRYVLAWLSWRQLKTSNTIGVSGDIMYLLGRTKLSRITSFQRIHYEKTNEDSASFRNCMSPRPSEPTAALHRFPKGFSTLRIKSRLFKQSFT